MRTIDESPTQHTTRAIEPLRDDRLNGIFSREGFKALKGFERVPQQAPQHPKFFLPDLQLTATATPTNGDEVSSWTLPIGANSDKKDVHLKSISRPAGYPKSWKTPETTILDGKCGITAVSNMLRWYGVEKNPSDLDKSEYRSWGPGLRVDKFASNMEKLTGKSFLSKTVEDGTDPLETLRGHLKDGKPVAIEYMCGSTSAHWVIVTSVSDDKNNPELVVQSWGGYYSVKFDEIKDGWRRGYGGPYPYVVGNEAATVKK